MKNQKQKQSQKASARGGRVSLITIATIVTILIGAAIAVASKQLSRSQAVATDVKEVAKETGKKYVTVKVAGRDVQVDPQTGQIKPLTPAEAQELANGLKTMLNKSSDGLVQEQHEDGSVSMKLQGRFQNVVVARTNADGTNETACFDEAGPAAEFFGIDPALVGAKPSRSASSQSTTTRQPNRTPAKKAIQ